MNVSRRWSPDYPGTSPAVKIDCIAFKLHIFMNLYQPKCISIVHTVICGAVVHFLEVRCMRVCIRNTFDETLHLIFYTILYNTCYVVFLCASFSNTVQRRKPRQLCSISNYTKATTTRIHQSHQSLQIQSVRICQRCFYTERPHLDVSVPRSRRDCTERE